MGEPADQRHRRQIAQQIAARGTDESADPAGAPGEDRQPQGPGQKIGPHPGQAPAGAQNQPHQHHEQVLQDDGHRADGNGHESPHSRQGGEQGGQYEFLEVVRRQDRFPFIDGFVTSPSAALHFSPRHCSVPSVSLIPRASQALLTNLLRNRRPMVFGGPSQLGLRQAACPLDPRCLEPLLSVFPLDP